MDTTRITPAGDPFYAASQGSRRTDQDPDHPHYCYAGWVYLGRIAELLEGEEEVVIEAVPCRRCADEE